MKDRCSTAPAQETCPRDHADYAVSSLPHELHLTDQESAASALKDLDHEVVMCGIVAVAAPIGVWRSYRALLFFLASHPTMCNMSFNVDHS